MEAPEKEIVMFDKLLPRYKVLGRVLAKLE